jgi:hypothetical protein
MHELITERSGPESLSARWQEEAMKYALLIYRAPEPRADQAPPEGSPTYHDGVFDTWSAYTRALKDAGALLALERLQGVETATAVRLRGGERLLTDGPFVETKEHLLGFYLVEVPDLDAAIAWAARMPHVGHGAVEVRPVMPTPALHEILAE